MLGLAAESFRLPPAEMFADERKLPEGSAQHPHFLGARRNPLAHLNCYRHRGTTDFRTSAESVCLLRDKEKTTGAQPRILQAVSSVSSVHNLSPGLLRCLQEEAGRGKGANARLPALLLANAGNRTGACQNTRAPELSLERHPHSPRASTGVVHTDALRAYNAVGDAVRLPKDRKASPNRGGRWQPRDGISPLASGQTLSQLLGKTWDCFRASVNL